MSDDSTLHDVTSGLRLLPSVEVVRAQLDAGTTPSDLLLAWIREVLHEARTEIRAGASAPRPDREDWTREIVRRVGARRAEQSGRVLRRVLNCTGVLLHTNLGRAPLSAEAQRAVLEATAGYSNLELDLALGKRRSRLLPVRELLARVTGAEAGLAVHNNAAAVFLTLRGLARGREVIVSRGHLVEIGGSFRLPTIMEASGARLVEVGATNRTRLSDYAERIGPATGLILKVHPSNFRMVGFTEEVGTDQLAELAHAHGIPLFEDIGSGALHQHGELAFDEPKVQDSLQSGADLVAFSGDKLLGGPQAGLLVGQRALIDRLAKDPIARVVRLDKIGLAALESTLLAYLDPATVRSRIPLLRLLAATETELTERATRLAEDLAQALGSGWSAEVHVVECEIGGGSLPGLTLPSRAVTLHHADWSPNRLAKALRGATPGVVGRIEQDRFLLDVRTLQDGDEPLVLSAVRTLAGR